ncbi:MAG: tetratricopeptide repeat-containing protein [Pseudomonadota bacterium]
MARAFIVRPFGTKQGVDFDQVEQLLLQPALAAAGIRGATTTEIVEQGNIREDMFRLLVSADLVIADVSIHNANVFYELGIRHGLRPCATLLLRADMDGYPFDLQTDRYLVYDHQDPATKVADLARAIKATLDSARVDSPVYRLLPGLEAPDPVVLQVVPREFREAVQYAQESGLRGDLRLLAHEARDFDWSTEGLRAVGRAQFHIGARHGARETFEWLLERRPDDVEANTRLATLYQRLGDLARSDQALRRVLEADGPSRHDRAETFALLGRNAKSRWLGRWKDKSGGEARTAALRAPELDQAIDYYAQGFGESLNHFYSGLNALALLAVRNELAQALPAVWAERFDTDEEAARRLEADKARFQQLAGAVQLSIEAARRALERRPNGEEALWTAISEADFALITDRRPGLIAQRYRNALSGAPDFARSSVADQLTIFRRLEVRSDFAGAALAVLEELGGVPAPAAGPAIARVLLFTGHMVDAEGREPPRFPRTRAAESAARAMIRKAVEDERALEAGRIVGIAGGASGGDILFHEVCAELGIDTRLYLALPPPLFCARSVQHAGPDWVERYQRLCERVPPRVLAEREELPRWLAPKKDYGIWQRNNLWMLFNALALDAPALTLIALWDQGRADGPGGTEDLVAQVTMRGLKYVRLPAEELKTKR